MYTHQRQGQHRNIFESTRTQLENTYAYAQLEIFILRIVAHTNTNIDTTLMHIYGTEILRMIEKNQT